jgi:hypothetical protein
MAGLKFRLPFNGEDSGIIARMAEHAKHAKDAKHATDAKDKNPADKYGRTPLQWRRFRYNSQDAKAIH